MLQNDRVKCHKTSGNFHKTPGLLSKTERTPAQEHVFTKQFETEKYQKHFLSPRKHRLKRKGNGRSGLSMISFSDSFSYQYLHKFHEENPLLEL